MMTPIVRFLRELKRFYITILRQTPRFSETRDISAPQSRDMKMASISQQEPILPSPRPRLVVAQSETEAKQANAHVTAEPDVVKCIYCAGRDVVKRGLRKKKYETVQLYLCHHCNKTFVWQRVKGKRFPLRVILEGLSLYNIRYSMEEVCQRIKEQFGLDLKTSTISDWVKEFGSICRYTRLRPYGLKLYSREQAVQTVHLFHRQVYDFSVHRAKLALTLQALQRFMLCNDSVTVATEVPVHMDYMEECNKTIVYLKQIRDIFGDDVEGV